MKRTKGIDVSKYQGVINWKLVQQDGISFAILRAGYGKYASQKDPMFERNDAECRSLQMPMGVYWYSYALTEEEAAEEASACLTVLQNRTYHLPVWFDIEDRSQTALSREKATAIADCFCQQLQKNGYTVGIYSYQSFLESHFTEEIRNKYPVWIAHTGVTKTNYALPYQIWQFSHTGKVSGILGDVDLNYMYNSDIIEKDASPNLIPVVASVAPLKYQVQKGDTLLKIAARYKTTVQNLAVQNGIIDPNKIYVGQNLTIGRNETQQVYVVKEGDTLTVIAKEFHTTVSELLDKNQIKDPDMILIGQKIHI